jgi:ABC-2 type transport system permease protein
MNPVTSSTPTIAARGTELLGAEWIKIRSVRSTHLMLLGAAVVTLGLGMLATSGVKNGTTDFFDPVETSLGGSIVAQLLFAVFGALTITAEHSTGTIRTTFTAMPRRRAVLAAKIALVAAIGLLVGGAIAFAAFFLGQQELSGQHLNTSLAAPGVLRAVLGAGFYLAVMAVVGLGLGAIIRHTAGALAAIGLLVVEPLLVLPGFGAVVNHSVLWWAGQALMSSRSRGPATCPPASHSSCAWSTSLYPSRPRPS